MSQIPVGLEQFRFTIASRACTKRDSAIVKITQIWDIQGSNGMDSGPYFLSSLYGQLHTLTTILLAPTIVAVHRGHFSGLSGPSEAVPPLRIVALR